MEIVRIVRRGVKNSRVQLEDGTCLLVETSLAVVGGEISTKLERKIDSVRELRIITAMLKKFLNLTGSKIPSYLSIEDMAQEIFVSMWEKNYWSLYKKSFGLSWESFIYTGVKNFMLSYTNSAPQRSSYKTYSLNKKISEESGDEFGDMLPSESNPQDDVLDKILMEQLMARIAEAGPTGLPGLTYMDLFKALLSGKKQSEISRETGWSETTLSSRKRVIQEIVSAYI